MVAGADGSDGKEKMGAGFCTLDMGRAGETWEEVTARDTKGKAGNLLR